ncbi:hypothetical protein Pint_32481 [Pistacia integerrima]|uniref:Uncharacterized protein n=1 Tax=Pistacia integerrima TaxID=434235 RepID=A0ACC0XRI4_9ROSI|nr:hypothetical protein Pint_32481 [Pistacia integerrima]
MASTSKVNAEEEVDEAEEEELERFDDFTLPSSWESIGLSSAGFFKDHIPYEKHLPFCRQSSILGLGLGLGIFVLL